MSQIQYYKKIIHDNIVNYVLRNASDKSEEDQKNLIPEDYNLEVSSPGIERPLTRLKDFHKFKGIIFNKSYVFCTSR